MAMSGLAVVGRYDLEGWVKGRGWGMRTEMEEKGAYSTYDSVMACKMSFTVLASEDLVGVEVDVVSEPHPCRFGGGSGGEADVRSRTAAVG